LRGVDPRIHGFVGGGKDGVAGSSPAKTIFAG
jgi:hypothetical protein